MTNSTEAQIVAARAIEAAFNKHIEEPGFENEARAALQAASDAAPTSSLPIEPSEKALKNAWLTYAAGAGDTAYEEICNTVRAAYAVDALDAKPAQGWMEQPAQVFLFDDLNGVVIGGRKHGWLVWRHPDGQWVTVQKADVRDPLECVPDIFKPAAPIPSAPTEKGE